jgi:GNAT superfamily N-acetyltransferase
VEKFEIKDYKSIKLLDIECEKPFDWKEDGLTHIKVCLPSNLENTLTMLHRGFFLADRLLDVSVNLKNTKNDFCSMVRMKPYLTSNKKEDVLRIALKSFPGDRRFHVGIRYDNEIADQIISDWVSMLTEYYICEYKEQVIGFLALEKNKKDAFVHLAAVEEKYRVTGAAVSLYAYVADMCRKDGYSLLNGRISALNTPVINLYAFLGAVFSGPMDIFLKEVG